MEKTLRAKLGSLGVFVHTRRAALLAVGMLAAVVGTPGPAAAATERVEIHDYHYEPQRVRIAPGDLVEWKNTGDEAHTVSSDDGDDEDFDSDELGNGDAYRHTFADEGIYRYHCEIHDDMTGVVEVVASTTTTSSTTTSSTTTTSTTTTTAPAPTTTRPPPTTTPPPPTATTTVPRPPASAPAPPPEAATEDDPSTTSTSTSTTTTTTEPAPTTVPPPPPEADAPLGPEAPATTSPVDDSEERVERQDAAARSGDPGGGDGVDAGASVLLAVLLGSGLFGAWTLWRLRRVRN